MIEPLVYGEGLTVALLLVEDVGLHREAEHLVGCPYVDFLALFRGLQVDLHCLVEHPALYAVEAEGVEI